MSFVKSPKSCNLIFERFLTHSLLHSFCHCDEVFLLRKEKITLIYQEKTEKKSLSYNHQLAGTKNEKLLFQLIFHMGIKILQIEFPQDNFSVIVL